MAIVGLLGLSFGLGLQWLRAKRLEEDRRTLRWQHQRLDEMLGASPDGHVRWDYENDGLGGSSDGEEIISRRLAILLDLYGGTGSRFDDVVDRFGADDGVVLRGSVRGLRERGDGFAIDLLHRDGLRMLRATGVRTATDDGAPLADVVWMRDVTEDMVMAAGRGQEAQVLTEDRNRYKALLDALPLPVWLRDETLTLRYCNAAYASAADAGSADEAVAKGSELASGEAAREARALAARARAAGKASTHSLHLIIGGERRLIDLTEVPMTIDGEAAHRLTAGIAVDRTGVEEVKSALDRHLSAHAAVLENLPTATAIFGTDTRLTFFNNAFGALWGLDEEWLRTAPAYSEFLEALREKRLLPEVADFPAFKEQEIKKFTTLIDRMEDLLHLPDGMTLLRTLSPHPMGGLMATFEDVTDLLGLESEYNTLIAVQRETLDHLNEAVAVFGSDGRLRLNNPAYGRLWNLGPDELTEDAHLNEILDKQRPFFSNVSDWPALKAELTNLISGRSAHQGRIERSDGVMLAYLCFPLPDGGVLLTYEDVSDATRVERALRERNEALRAANKLKSEFITNVSSELNRPLTNLARAVEMLGEGKLNAEQTEQLEGISNAARDLDTLIGDIVDLASVEAGSVTLELDAFDVPAMIEEVLPLVRETVKRKGLDLTVDCAPDMGWMVADEKRIKQVLYNLLHNAVKFTPDEGKVSLSAAEDNEEMVFVVTDTGAGIPAREKEKVFGSFASGKGSTGAGLGLSLVRRFVELHGGRVQLDSSPRKGTKVTCRIPIGGENQGAQLSILDAVARVEAKDKKPAKKAAPKKKPAAKKKPVSKK